MTPTVAAKKPAVGAAAKALPYTGREYLDSLDDGREDLDLRRTRRQDH